MERSYRIEEAQPQLFEGHLSMRQEATPPPDDEHRRW